MRDELGNVFSLKQAESKVATQRLGGGMISDEQIISVSASKITGGEGPGGGTTENPLTIELQNGTFVEFDGGDPETIHLTKVDTSLSEISENAISNKATSVALKTKANTTGTYQGITAGKVQAKLKFTGAATAEFDGASEVVISIPQQVAPPTKVSELTNDSGFQTSSNVTAAITSALTPYMKKADGDSAYVLKTDLAAAITAAITPILASYYTKVESDARFAPKVI